VPLNSYLLKKKKKAIENHIVPLRIVDCEALLKTMLGGGFIFLPLLEEDDPLLKPATR